MVENCTEVTSVGHYFYTYCISIAAFPVYFIDISISLPKIRGIGSSSGLLETFHNHSPHVKPASFPPTISNEAASIYIHTYIHAYTHTHVYLGFQLKADVSGIRLVETNDIVMMWDSTISMHCRKDQS
jgi:hypothetical protein